MTSVVSICNLALAHLGDEATVTDIDPPEGSQQAEHCARYYPIARNTLLESHPWSFATRRVTLVTLAGTPPGSWGFMYQRPNGVLRPLSVLLPGVTDNEQAEEFIEETLTGDVRVIYTNVGSDSTDTAVLRYIALVEDTTKYSALFVNALARLLASYLAGPIIKGAEGMKAARSQLEAYEKIDFPRAKTADSNARKLDHYADFVPSSIQARL